MIRFLLAFFVVFAIAGCGGGAAGKDRPAASRSGDEEGPSAAAGRARLSDDDESEDDDDEAPARKKKPAKMAASTKKAFGAAQRKLDDSDIKGALEVLEAALPDDPENIDLLINLAKFNEILANPRKGKPDASRHIKAAGYLEQALKIDPDVSMVRDVRRSGPAMFVSAALALAADNQPDRALKYLRLLGKLGFTNFDALEEDPDLKPLRELSGFPAVVAELRAAYRKQVARHVAQLFKQNEPFDFDFKLKDIQGKPIAKSDFKGKVLVVDLWGTWCGPCQMEIPHFVKLYENYKDQGVEVVGLNNEQEDEDEALQTVRQFHKKNDMNYRCALADQETMDQVPDMEGLPTTLFFDRAGKVRVKAGGYHDYDTLEMIVQRLLEESPASSGAR